jgi:hypothetical protein
VAISTILAVLLGKAFSLTVMEALDLTVTAISFFLLGRELFQLRRKGGRWPIGWRPLGGTLLILALCWVALAIWSLIDFQKGQTLLTSLFTFDHSYRVSWIQSILRTGVPPANPLYLYKHPAPMRNYYFWYVVCAEVERVSHLSVRSVLNASCIWAGFAFAALIGLYLKHFLHVGARLRRQFLLAILLLAVTGLDLIPYVWEAICGVPVAGDLDLWSRDPIYSWYGSFLWVPHHVASLVCCMFAFLLAWMSARDGKQNRVATFAFISAALASAFGLSVFVTFGFFLVMLIWGPWQIGIERNPRPVWSLALGGVGAAALLIPYLLELTRNSSNMQGSAVFGFGVREMIPPGFVLNFSMFRHLDIIHPEAARTIANLILLAPGYAFELGFYLVVLLIYVVPSWRGQKQLSSTERSLLVIAVATVPVITFIRSWVLNTNDFGWRAAAILQFPLLLLASSLLVEWGQARKKQAAQLDFQPITPRWLRSICSITLALGLAGTFGQALVIRYFLTFTEMELRAHHASPDPSIFTHNPYISAVGYAHLDAAIPRDAVVQFNPNHPYLVGTVADVMGIDHQTVIVSDRQGCGSELGGDPSGCPAMASLLDSLYNSSSAEQARAVCRQLGIQYLVARIYDPAWENKQSWVWTLSPVVSDEEFRALDCR